MDLPEKLPILLILSEIFTNKLFNYWYESPEDTCRKKISYIRNCEFFLIVSVIDCMKLVIG